MPELDLLSVGAGVGVGLAAAWACAPAAAAAAAAAAAPQPEGAGLSFSHMGIFAVDPESLGTLCGSAPRRAPLCFAAPPRARAPD